MSYCVKPLIATSVAAAAGYAFSSWKIGAATGLVYAAYEVINQCNKEQPTRRITDHTYEHVSSGISTASSEPRAAALEPSFSSEPDEIFKKKEEESEKRYFTEKKRIEKAIALLDNKEQDLSIENLIRKRGDLNEQRDANIERFEREHSAISKERATSKIAEIRNRHRNQR